MRGEVSGSYLVSLTAAYPFKLNGLTREGETVMSLRYNA
jgi:hypothetical protein